MKGLFVIFKIRRKVAVLLCSLLPAWRSRRPGRAARGELPKQRASSSSRAPPPGPTSQPLPPAGALGGGRGAVPGRCASLRARGVRGPWAGGSAAGAGVPPRLPPPRSPSFQPPAEAAASLSRAERPGTGGPSGRWPRLLRRCVSGHRRAGAVRALPRNAGDGAASVP